VPEKQPLHKPPDKEQGKSEKGRDGSITRKIARIVKMARPEKTQSKRKAKKGAALIERLVLVKITIESYPNADQEKKCRARRENHTDE